MQKPCKWCKKSIHILQTNDGAWKAFEDASASVAHKCTGLKVKWLSLNPYEKAIFDTIYRNDPLNFLHLYELTYHNLPMSIKTFTKYLKSLVDEDLVNKKEIGQNREYSIGKNKKELQLKFSKFLNKLIDDTQKHYNEILEIFKQYKNKKKYSKLNRATQIEIFDNVLASVSVILRAHPLLLLIVRGGFTTSETKQKAKDIQKKYNQQLGELIDLYRQIDPALSRMILLNVFEDLYPREERPEDPILI